MAKGFDLPITVTLDRADQAPLDLTPMIEPGTLNWSSVVPGGFASCGFQINGDFRSLLKLLPYLTIVRVVGDSGRVLFEGQIEDLQPTLTSDGVGLTVGAFGLQNALKEQSVRAIWSKRDMQWDDTLIVPGSSTNGLIFDPALTVNTGAYLPTDLGVSGVSVASSQTSAALANNHGAFAEYVVPLNIQLVRWLGVYDPTGTNSATNKMNALWFGMISGVWNTLLSAVGTSGSFNTWSFDPRVGGVSPTILRVGYGNLSGASYTPAATDTIGFWDMRLLGVLTAEDVSPVYGSFDPSPYGGFYGDTLIRSVLSLVAAITPGNIESPLALDSNPFVIDHLDASARRTAYEVIQEIASYYSREWAVWENATLDWKNPNLQQTQWVIPIAQLATMNLDASVVNSQRQAIILYTDAVTQQTAEASAASTDRRNPYTLRGRTKDNLVDAGLTMTANTAAQLAKQVLADVGFGPVPASGSISLVGEQIVQHASGRALKAWEIRAGDNVTIPELPLADVFTQDGRGECLFHVVSAEATDQSGMVTLTLDSYGSKRSDVLLARLAAVTQLLGG